MRKNSLLLIALFYCTFDLSAQTVLESDSLISKNYKINPEKFIGQNESSFFFLNSSTEGSGVDFIISKYDLHSHKQLFSKQISVLDDSKVPVCDAFLCNDKILIFRQFHEKKNGENHTIILQIMDTSGVLQDDLKEIVKTTTSPSDPPNAFKGGVINELDYSFYTSEDKKKILIVSEEYKNIMTIKEYSRTQTKVLLSVFDAEKLKINSTKELPLDYEKSKRVYGGYKIDTHENIFFHYDYTNSENKLKKAIGVLHATNSSAISTDIQIDLFNNKIKDLNFIVHEAKIYCSAIYEKQNLDSKKKSIKLDNKFGILYQTIDIATFKTENIDTARFTSDVVSKLEDNAYLNKCEIGSIKVINGELYTICQFYDYFYYKNSKTPTFYFGPFIVSKYDQKKINWMRTIPNKFINITGDNSLYLVLPDKNNFRFVYFEHPVMEKKIQYCNNIWHV